MDRLAWLQLVKLKLQLVTVHVPRGWSAGGGEGAHAGHRWWCEMAGEGG